MKTTIDDGLVEALSFLAREEMRRNYPVFAIIRLLLWWQCLMEKHGWRSYMVEKFNEEWFKEV